MDFRLPENRRELLIRYSAWQYLNHDVDTAIPLTDYIFNRLEYNINQRFWFVFLYAYSYNVATALALWNEMPDIECVDIDRIERLVNNNFSNIAVESDVKWNKGKLARMTKCFLATLSGRTPEEYFNDVCCSNNPYENYRILWDTVIDDFHGFGRYVTWFFLQSLYRNCHLNILPDDMKYGYDNQSSTDGLCYIMNKPDWASRLYINDGTKKIKQSVKYDKDIISEMNNFTDSVIEEINSRYNIDITYFEFETILCSIKKLWRRRDGRYLGYYLDRLMKNVNQAEKAWPGVDYNIVRDWAKESLHPQLYNNISNSPVTSKMQEFLDHGKLSIGEYNVII